MASFQIHLAIGKQYMKKNEVNEREFLRGIVEPDLVQDKKISHYTGNSTKNDLLDYLPKKVQLYEYLKHNTIDSDYQRGVFLHLVTDYLFFNTFFDIDYLKSVTYKSFWQDLYYSYVKTSEYIIDTYKIDYMDVSEQINRQIEKDISKKETSREAGIDILPLGKLDAFIRNVSSIDLDDYKSKVLKNRRNVLP